jgi:hypothetical protein
LKKILVLAAVASLIAACQVLVGLSDPVSIKDPPAPPRTCGSIPPSQPLRDNDPSRFLGLVAMRSASIVTDIDVVPGYNLDGLCTCSELPSGPACKGKGKNCDIDGGVDNGLGTALRPFTQLGATDINTVLGVTDRITKGEVTTLFHLSSYNGKLNDSEISIGITRSYGYRGQHAQDGCVAPDAGGPKPLWTGCDRWAAPKDTWFGAAQERGGAALALRFPGYVRDGKLILRTDTSVSIRLGAANLEIGTPTVTADIELLDANRNVIAFGSDRAEAAVAYRFKNGILAGRARAEQVLRTVTSASTASAIANGTKDGLCDPSSPVYSLLKTTLCDGRDLPLTAVLDGKESGSCEAISVVFRFEAEPIFLSNNQPGGIDEVTDPFPPVSPCPALFGPNDAGAALADAGRGDAGDAGVRDAATEVDAAPRTYLDPAVYFACP